MKRNAALWTGLLLGPIVWLIAFETGFALTDWACAMRARSAALIIWLVALAITSVSGLLAWSEWRRLGREVPGDGAGAVPRARLMALGGVLLSGLMCVVIVAQAIPAVLLEACQ